MKLLFFSFAPVKSFPLPRSSRKRGKETFFLPLLFRSPPPSKSFCGCHCRRRFPQPGNPIYPFVSPLFCSHKRGWKKKNPFFSPPSFPLQQPRSPWKWASEKKDSFLTRRKQLQKILWKKGFGIRTRSGERLWKGEREEALPLRLQLSFPPFFLRNFSGKR